MLKVRKKITWLDFDSLVLDAIWDEGVIVPIWPLAIHQNSVWHPKLLSIIKHLSQVLQEK
jgi:hypothetical protein